MSSSVEGPENSSLIPFGIPIPKFGVTETLSTTNQGDIMNNRKFFTADSYTFHDDGYVTSVFAVVEAVDRDDAVAKLRKKVSRTVARLVAYRV